MDAVVNYVGTVAASGTQTVAIPFPSGLDLLEVQIVSQYAATSAVTGIQIDGKKSADGGSTYQASGHTRQVHVPHVTNTPLTRSVVYKRSSPVSGGGLTHARVDLTNLDATNAATVCVISQIK